METQRESGLSPALFLATRQAVVIQTGDIISRITRKRQIGWGLM